MLIAWNCGIRCLWLKNLPQRRIRKIFSRGLASARIAFSSIALLREPTLSRFSFLTADPFDFLEFPPDGSDALATLAERMGQFACVALPGLPPFQGGAAGLLSYDFGGAWRACHYPRPMSFACRPWPLDCTMLSLRSTTRPAGHGSSRKVFPKLSPPAAASVPQNGSNNFVVGSANLTSVLAAVVHRKVGVAVALPPLERKCNSLPSIPCLGLPGLTATFPKIVISPPCSV